MKRWRLGEQNEDGEAWLANPAVMHAYVDYVSEGPEARGEWRRIMVVTRSWLGGQLESDGRLLLPSLLVLDDGPRSELLQQIEDAVSSTSLDRFSKRLQKT